MASKFKTESDTTACTRCPLRLCEVRKSREQLEEREQDVLKFQEHYEQGRAQLELLYKDFWHHNTVPGAL